MRAKLLRRIAVMTGLSVALLASSTTPAHAAVVGDGVVAGTVTVSPGIDLTTRPTSFSFGATSITGAVTVRDNVNGNVAFFAGNISVGTVTGSSTGENTLVGTGTVSSFGFSGSTVVGPITTTVNGTISGGSFARVGPTVIVTLNLASITVTTSGPLVGTVSATTVGGLVVVAAVFVPTVGQNGLGGQIDPNVPSIPGGNQVTDASFLGNFTVVGAP